MTGKWGAGEDAAELLKLDEEDDDEVYGDFEDLETGEKVRRGVKKTTFVNMSRNMGPPPPPSLRHLIKKFLEHFSPIFTVVRRPTLLRTCLKNRLFFTK